MLRKYNKCRRKKKTRVKHDEIEYMKFFRVRDLFSGIEHSVECLVIASTAPQNKNIDG